MSSAIFSSRIRPEAGLRAVVLGSGLAFALVGVAIIAYLPLALQWRAAGAAAWLSASAFEWILVARAYRDSRSYTVFADGSIDIESAGGARMAAVFAAGSVVLPGIAWLRLRAADGRQWGELIRGNSGEDEDWRRFQVICRHVAAC